MTDSSLRDIPTGPQLVPVEPWPVAVPASVTAESMRLHTRQEWVFVGLLAAVALLVIPLLKRLPAAESALHLPDYLIPLLGKFVCYGIVALAMDMIWGYAGILSLGHGVFFALGRYALGMHLMRAIGAEGVYRSALPDFMVFLTGRNSPGTGTASLTSASR